ncbi:hypothetical protein WG907_18000 [Sphingobium sp. AN558]|uniref:hypothetical protein n=1 Tax=Sphingobium sp. AN558 TaxID=3133442 RepID=UPI0030BDE92B
MSDDAVVKAMGTALSVIAATLERGGVAKAQELANILGMCGTIASQDGEEAEGLILGAWAAMIEDSAGTAVKYDN